MRNFLFSILFTILILISCEKSNSVIYNVEKPNYRTIVWVYYGRSTTEYILYSKDSIYTCSFQGTNFLLEKNNEHEILSTTAPIRVLNIKKLELLTLKKNK
jgi:hypothetical protein